MLRSLPLHCSLLALSGVAATLYSDTGPEDHAPDSIWEHLRHMSETSETNLNEAATCFPSSKKTDAYSNESAVKTKPRNGDSVVEVPYKEEFLDENSFSHLTVIDRDGDGHTWELVMVPDYETGEMQGYAKVFINSEDAQHISDDWLVTPPIHLMAGKDYIFFFKETPDSTARTTHSTFGWDTRRMGIQTLIHSRNFSRGRF